MQPSETHLKEIKNVLNARPELSRDSSKCHFNKSEPQNQIVKVSFASPFC